ncbi:MAG: hypothetical protein ACFFBV_04265 [Promethearchaeota archaeon]
MEVDTTILVRFSDFLGKLIGKNRGFTEHKVQNYLRQNVRSDLDYVIKNFGMTSDSGHTYHIKIPGLGEIQDKQIINDIDNIREAWRVPFPSFLKSTILVLGLSFILAFTVSFIIYIFTSNILATMSTALILFPITAFAGLYYLGYCTKERLIQKSPESFKLVSQLFYYLELLINSLKFSLNFDEFM